MLIVSPGDEQRQDAERHRQRQREQDRDRMQERLELRREHDVHEDERQRDREDEASSPCAPAPRIGRPARRRSPPACADRRPAARTAAISSCCEQPGRDVRRQRHLPLTIQALDARRSRGAFDPHHLAQRDGAAARRRPSCAPGPRRLERKRWFGANRDVVLFVADVVARRLAAADQHVQRLRDVLHPDAQVGRALPVDFDAQLGLADDQRRYPRRRRSGSARTCSKQRRRSIPPGVARSGPGTVYWTPIPPPPPPDSWMLVRSSLGYRRKHLARADHHLFLRGLSCLPADGASRRSSRR